MGPWRLGLVYTLILTMAAIVHQVILAADSLYDDNHPLLLASAVRAHLSHAAGARFVAMVPLRDAITRKLIAEFQARLGADEHDGHRHPLRCLEEHTLTGQDDWGEDEETHRVECWWGVFGRGEPVVSAVSSS
jgi:hypothetical protein